MKIRFALIGALAGATISLGLNPALASPTTQQPTNLMALLKGRAAAKPQTAAAPAAPGRAASGNSAYSALIGRYARAYGVPVALATAVVHHESNFQPNTRGSAGEIGLMQIKLQTARAMGYSGSAKGLYAPEVNIQYGMKYLALAHKLGGGSVCGAILKYNAGHGATRMNPVSARYCSSVKAYMRLL